MRICLLTVIIFCIFCTQAQPDTLSGSQKRNRRLILVSTTGAVAAGSLVYLNYAWYSDYKTSDFHLFNDNKEWLQMDKAGHAFSSYQAGRLMMDGFRWAGFTRKQQLIAGSTGFIYLTAIEIMDGYSEGWGFSWGDEIANALGASLAIAQKAAWDEQKFTLKFSYAKSGLAVYNPSLLGNTPTTRLLKDYNSQIYWLSFNPVKIIAKNSAFPAWLNIAIGYSAFGMLGGHYNNIVAQNEKGETLKYDRIRQYLISIDIDCTKIKTRSQFLKSVFSVVNMIKIPAPALILDKKGTQFNFL